MATRMIMLDRAQAPSVTQAKAALGEVGGHAWGYYLGGAGHNHDRTTYTPDLIRALHQEGIRTLPIYVSDQHAGFTHVMGVTDGGEAARRARVFGDDRVAVLCDVERHPYDRDPAAALAYARGFCRGAHTEGLRAGAYGPFALMSALTDPAQAEEVPDVLWPARWMHDAGILAPQAKWPTDPRHVKGVPPDRVAVAGGRAWQFAGEIVLPVSGVNVDVSVIDAECFAGHPATVTHPNPAPHPAPVPAPHVTVPPQQHRTVMVKPNDTLSALERELGLPFGSLFRRNKTVLDAAARAHGHADSRHGGLIFAGTPLDLP